MMCGIEAGCGTDAPGSYIAWLSTQVPVHSMNVDDALVGAMMEDVFRSGNMGKADKGRDSFFVRRKSYVG